jgi:hypothetical protein
MMLYLVKLHVHVAAIKNTKGEHSVSHGNFRTEKALLLPVVWLFLSVSLGLLIGYSSPHGMAAFIYTSVVQGVLCGLASLGVYCWLGRVRNQNTLPSTGLWLGVIGGSVTFPVATLLSERLIYMPHNVYQVVLLTYLTCSGGLFGWLITRYFLSNEVTGPSSPQ